MWSQLPEHFREKLAEAARRARQAAPVRSGEIGDGVPPCEDVTTPYGPSRVRELIIPPGQTGLEESFGKIRALEDLLDREEGLPGDLTPQGLWRMKDVVFLDLETTGFSSTPLFLAGTMTLEDGNLCVRQFFAKDYSQEKSLLHRLSEFLSGYEILVSFNGKSYDLPFVKDRFCFHDLAFEPPAVHLDLLHAARRRWKYEFPNCRLVTLEWHLCGRQRFGDIPGAEIPRVYHEFVRRGYSSAMKQVFHHNVLDLVTLAELLCEIAVTPIRHT
jgi:uncharacterized protein YprB with RNaseH-like and TPR domain